MCCLTTHAGRGLDGTRVGAGGQHGQTATPDADKELPRVTRAAALDRNRSKIRIVLVVGPGG